MKKLEPIKTSFKCAKCEGQPFESGYLIKIDSTYTQKWCDECVKKHFIPDNDQQQSEVQETKQRVTKTRRRQPRQREVQRPQPRNTGTGRRRPISLGWRIIYIILGTTLLVNIIWNCVIS